MPRYRGLAVAAVAVMTTLVAPASAAQAADPTDKAAVLAAWTQPAAASYTAWNNARLNQAAWASYGFDWTTDYCTTSPDQPSGFDFRLACRRHDFGYRNYDAAGLFPANKTRLDETLYADLSRRCDTYNAIVRPACDGLAWTYYQAARQLGRPKVSPAELERAERMKNDALRRAAAEPGASRR
ncbi:phospholipase [Actinoplanes sp. TRM 88003]|uniref:Phospholipase n=1 Tax=Paractinoplanes aksuensis TaxID=2939490 RepID=A0ABT1DXE1_9ACTN|nr:phospholipase [Actinoplanes aksuensis]MCO8275537.1 phospholipase [Actinoplanes aksuensis]